MAMDGRPATQSYMTSYLDTLAPAMPELLVILAVVAVLAPVSDVFERWWP